MGVSPSRAVCECAADECLLVGRCLAGEQAAWEEFFAARTPDLVRLAVPVPEPSSAMLLALSALALLAFGRRRQRR